MAFYQHENYLLQIILFNQPKERSDDLDLFKLGMFFLLELPWWISVHHHDISHSIQPTYIKDKSLVEDTSFL